MRRHCFLMLWVLLSVVSAGAQVITTVAGGGPNNLPATSANIAEPLAAITDGSGNLYVASPTQNCVFKVGTTGTLTIIAGNGTPGFGGDGGPATSALLDLPQSLAVDSAGNVFIADSNNQRIRRVNAVTGVITTVAGNGDSGFGGDGGAATAANLTSPSGLAVDSSGNLFIADTLNQRIRRVDAGTGVITTVAGTGTATTNFLVDGGDGGPATSASLNSPRGLAFDSSGNLFIADQFNQRIRRVAAGTGVITTVAGSGTFGFSGDGGAATSAMLENPGAVATDGAGNLYIADTFNLRIRRVDGATGVITTVAGIGQTGFSGDGGPATSASLATPSGVWITSSGDLLIADTDNQRIRQVSKSTGVITTVAGNGTAGFSGDGSPATQASLSNPTATAFEAAGNLLIADSINNRIRRVSISTGIITTAAGNGKQEYSGDGGPASSAGLNTPNGVAVDAVGNIFIADASNNRIRRVDAGTGVITTVAGTGTPNFSGDDGPATSATLSSPTGVAVDKSDNLFIADFGNMRIRKVDASTGNITTVAGNGTADFSGDGGPATDASLFLPFSVAVDASKNLFIADSANQRIRRVDATTGVITTVAGDGNSAFGGDSGAATSASLNFPFGVTVDGPGNLFIADSFNQRIRRVDAASGVITTVVGTGDLGFSGDGGAPTSALLASPDGVGINGAGELFIADTSNQRIRKVTPGGGGGGTTDTTPPVITPTVTGTLGNNGWYVSDVNISWSVVDQESAITSQTGCDSTTITTDTAGLTLTCSATSAGGTSSNSVTVKRDATPPLVSIVSPANGAVYSLKQVVTANYSCTDNLSGIASCQGPVTTGARIDTSTVGTKSFKVTAIDLAGNTASRTNSYSVQYNFRGFNPPVQNLPAVNFVRAGQSVPIKWVLTDALGMPISTPTAVVSLSSSPEPCATSASTSLTKRLATVDVSGFQPVPAPGQFVFIWHTSRSWTGCRMLEVTLADGTVHTALFQFRKGVILRPRPPASDRLMRPGDRPVRGTEIR